MNPDDVRANAQPILVVDDDRDLREAIAREFQRRGFPVQTAENGRQALEKLRAFGAKVVISDVRMPGGDGIELLRAVRVLDAEVPGLILVTGYADISAEEAYQLGADAMFGKPFDRKALMATVERLMLPREVRWVRRPDHVQPDTSIEAQLPEFGAARSSGRFNVGRGGMFVATGEGIPQAGIAVRFSVRFDSGEGIEGAGHLRWARPHGQRGYPSGCGIEFLYLEEPGLSLVLDLLRQAPVKAFIPNH